MQPSTLTMDPFALFNGVQEYTTRKSIVGEPSKEKEQSHQYSPRPQPLSASTSPRDSPKSSDFKKRKRGRPPLEKDSRVCSNCNTSETPEWRKGPLGPHTLCNACGLQWMKAQKRENEMKSKYEEARKKHSLIRVLNTHGNSTNVNTINMAEANQRTTSSTTITNIVDMNDNTNEFSRYYHDMETLSAEVSPNLSPMQAVSTPITSDALNTLKAMQTINALSHMNHINHINTLNHINILSTLNVPDSSSPSHFSAHNHTVINHYNSNLNSYNNNPSNNTNPFMSPDPNSSRYSHLTSPQQIYLPIYGSQPQTSSQINSYNPYIQHNMSPIMKDYTSPMNTQQHSPPLPPHQTIAAMSPSPSYIHNLQSLSHSIANPLLQPNHTLIPNPSALDDSSCITGGGQM